MAQLKFFVILLFASVVHGNIIKIDNLTVKKEVVTEVKNTVLDIVVDSKTGIIIFKEIVAGQEGKIKLKVYEPDKDGYRQIKEEYKDYSKRVTIDENNEIIYISTTKGIYKITKGTKKPTLFGQEGENIVNVQYKNNVLYFVTASFKPFKYVWVNGKPQVKEINIIYAKGLVVDSENNIYYVDEGGKLLKLPYGQTDSVPITGVDSVPITATIVDRLDDFYLSSADKQNFVVKKGTTDAKPVPSFENHTATAAFVAKNQISYVAEGSTIFKYTEIK